MLLSWLKRVFQTRRASDDLDDARRDDLLHDMTAQLDDMLAENAKSIETSKKLRVMMRDARTKMASFSQFEHRMRTLANRGD